VTLQHKTRLILKSQFNSLDSGAPKLALGGWRKIKMGVKNRKK
jgi:hypothetical protein